MSERKGFLNPDQEDFYSGLIIAALKAKGIVKPVIKLGLRIGDNRGLERLKDKMPDSTEEQIIGFIDEFTSMLQEVVNDAE